MKTASTASRTTHQGGIVLASPNTRKRSVAHRAADIAQKSRTSAARGHGDRSRREGRGTEKVLGGF